MIGSESVIAIIGYSIGILLCSIFACIVTMRIHAYRLTTQHYIFKNQKIKTDCKICFISDFHYQHFLATSHYQKMVEQVNAQKPDLVVFGGDYLHRTMSPSDDEATSFIQLLSEIQAPHKVAVLGNHDKDNFNDDVWRRIFQQHNIQLLINETLNLDHYGIHLIGVDDFKQGNAEIKTTDIDAQFQLLITHNPDFMETIQSTHVELVLSGHLHGGQGTIGFDLYPALRVFKLSEYGTKYRHGNVGNTQYNHISTSGIGAHFGLRLFVYPEIVCVDLKPIK